MRWPASMPSEVLPLPHCSINFPPSLPQKETAVDHTPGFWCLCTGGLGLPSGSHLSIPWPFFGAEWCVTLTESVFRKRRCGEL